MERLRLGDVGVAPHLVWTDVPPWVLPMPEIDMTVMSLAKAGFNYSEVTLQTLLNPAQGQDFAIRARVDFLAAVGLLWM
uniref:Uncharacterized protein n=1 Tax=Knipowitschia caucasica TaxID=637954 RepID=A0AAV2JYU1_KNICA